MRTSTAERADALQQRLRLTETDDRGVAYRQAFGLVEPRGRVRVEACQGAQRVELTGVESAPEGSLGGEEMPLCHLGLPKAPRHSRGRV